MAAVLMDRTQGIGSSDAGAILGVSPYRTPLEVYLEKIGELSPQEDTEAMYWGRELEELVAKRYAMRRGVAVRRANITRVHPKYPWMTANLDRLVTATDRLLECKTCNQYRADEWGEEGSDEVPQDCLAQTQHQLAVTARAVADVAVLIGGQIHRIYEIPRDEELIESLVEEEARFWDRCVRRDPPPAINLADAKRRWPRDNGRTIAATQEIEESVGLLKGHKRTSQICEQYEEELELMIKTYMGEHDTLLGSNHQPLVTWRTAKASNCFDAGRFAAEQPALYQQYLNERPGSRRFLTK